MAYATFEHDGRRRVGRVDGERLVPLAGLTELGRHTDVDVLRGATELPGEAVAVDGVRLCPVVPDPDKIICVGLNYLNLIGACARGTHHCRVRRPGRGALNPPVRAAQGAAMLSMTPSNGPVTGGVDTHARPITPRSSTISAVTSATRSSPATPGGYRALSRWMRAHDEQREGGWW